MLTHLALILAVVACLQYTGLVRAEPTTCGVGTQCSSCSGNKVADFVGTQVCCPGCVSQYFNYGTTNTGDHICNCNILRVTGNATRGEGCSESGQTTYGHLNSMPICCPDSFHLSYLGQDSNGLHQVICIPDGNCWRGEMCSVCNQNFVSRIGDLELCCPNCEEGGTHISIGYGIQCNCN